jgi:hypothetical protein
MMVAMPDPETPAIDPSGTRAPNASRRALRVSVSVMLLAGGVFFWEDWSGRRKLEEVKARFEREGFPLRAEAVFPPAPPAEENFGATPALDGLFAAPGSAGEAAAAARTKALSDLLPKEAATALRLDGAEIDWSAMREALARNAGANPLPEDLTDVAAVRAWLERHRALFTELDAAARRPHAVFTPVPTGNAGNGGVAARVSAPISILSQAVRLLTLRGLAAAAAGDEAEALSSARILWQFRRAVLAERSLLAGLVAVVIQNSWRHVALAMLAMPQPTDGSLAALAGMPGAEWSPEAELRQTWHGEALFAASLDPDKLSGDEIEMRGRTMGTALLTHGPKGWRHRAIATLLEARCDHMIAPLKSGSAGTFCAGLEGLASAEPTWLDTWSPFRVLQDWKVMRTVMRKAVHANQRTRLVLLAIAMERHRLRHGRYPASPAALVPDFLPQVPPDLDGQPLRVVTSPDGASAVLLSVGWNLVVDDPSGKAGSSSDRGEESPDWVLRLPQGKPQ